MELRHAALRAQNLKDEQSLLLTDQYFDLKSCLRSYLPIRRKMASVETFNISIFGVVFMFFVGAKVDSDIKMKEKSKIRIRYAPNFSFYKNLIWTITIISKCSDVGPVILK